MIEIYDEYITESISWLLIMKSISGLIKWLLTDSVIFWKLIDLKNHWIDFLVICHCNLTYDEFII